MQLARRPIPPPKIHFRRKAHVVMIPEHRALADQSPNKVNVGVVSFSLLSAFSLNFRALFVVVRNWSEIESVEKVKLSNPIRSTKQKAALLYSSQQIAVYFIGFVMFIFRVKSSDSCILSAMESDLECKFWKYIYTAREQCFVIVKFILFIVDHSPCNLNCFLLLRKGCVSRWRRKTCGFGMC